MPRFLLPSHLGPAINPKYEFPPHLQKVQEFVLNAIFKPDGRAVISLPVRTGKSYYCSYILPTWFLLNNPDQRIIFVSHSGRFSELYGNMVKQAINHFGEGPSALNMGYKSRADFRLNAGGGMFSCGWGSSVTGRGGNLIIIDDLVKDSLQVASATNREKMATWLKTDLLTRCEPDASIVSVLSRRHPEDPAGLFIDMGWPELRIPALNPQNVSIWPSRFPTSDLLRKKKELEESGQGWIWSCLYQGLPIDPQSVAFDPSWFDNILIDQEPKGGINIISVDPSKARKADQKNNDPCGVVVVNIGENNKLTVLDGFSKKIPANQIVEEIIELTKIYKPKAISVETIDLQILLLYDLEKRLQEEKLIYSTTLHKYEPKSDKVARIELSLTPFLAKSRIKIHDKACLRPLIRELEQFPQCTHDDFSDALTQSVWLATKLLG